MWSNWSPWDSSWGICNGLQTDGANHGAWLEDEHARMVEGSMERRAKKSTDLPLIKLVLKEPLFISRIVTIHANAYSSATLLLYML